jgi:hypothetical protein
MENIQENINLSHCDDKAFSLSSYKCIQKRNYK